MAEAVPRTETAPGLQIEAPELAAVIQVEMLKTKGMPLIAPRTPKEEFAKVKTEAEETNVDPDAPNEE